MYKKYFKRPFDIVISSLAILLLMPLMLIIALLVRIKLGFPIFYAVKRPGKDEQVFTMYKFRSMSNKCDEFGTLLPDTDRLTRFGILLRKSSLDELPELFNILKGEMSFVGPRPLALQYLPYYSESERRRHSVRPGLTGLAQVRNRNELNWEKRFEVDTEYIDNITFISDMKIILKTIIAALGSPDIGIRGLSAAEDFDKYRGRQIHNSKGEIML
jgi:undecaprenyl phosphate N,N'-diacetylbacillosamine 1-phosphate transferase